MTKLDTLIEVEGYEDEEELMNEVGFDSVVPGICMNPGCDYTTGVEPDCNSGFCEICGTNTVRSAVELLLF